MQCEDMSVRDAAASYVSELITHIQVQGTSLVLLLTSSLFACRNKSAFLPAIKLAKK